MGYSKLLAPSSPFPFNLLAKNKDMDPYVKSEFHNGITIIEFFHPQSNSLPAKLLEELAQKIHGAGNDDDTKVILLRSAGEKAFCAGASFDELMNIKTAELGFQFFSGFAHVINANAQMSTVHRCAHSW
jgi:methylglutaconyl-CoA hydratase